jgi:hypothetical protein
MAGGHMTWVEGCSLSRQSTWCSKRCDTTVS